MRSLAFLARALGVGVLLSSQSLAQDHPDFTLEWNAPSPCPSRRAVVARAERLAGKRVTAALETPVHLEARVDRVEPERWRLRLTALPQRPGATREIIARSCDELADTAALLIALSIAPRLVVQGSPFGLPSDLAIDQAEVERPPVPPAAAAPTPSAASAGASVQGEAAARRTPGATTQGEAAPQDAAILWQNADESSNGGGPGLEVAPAVGDRAVRPRYALEALFATWVGRLPGLAPGVVVRGGATVGRWHGAVDVGFFPERGATLAVDPSLGARLWMASGAIQIGYAVLDRGVLVVPFGAAELAFVHGEATAQRPEDGFIGLVGLAAGVRAAYPLSARWALAAHGQATVLMKTPGFTLGGVEVYRPFPVGGLFGVGMEFRVP